MDTIDITGRAQSGRAPPRAQRTLPPIPVLVIALVVGAAYAGLSRVASIVTAFGGTDGTIFWPAAGVTVAALIWRPRREWPWILCAVWVAEFSLDAFLLDVSFDLSAGWALANTVEPLVAASLLTVARLVPLDLALRRHMLGFIVAAVLVGPAIGALVGVGAGALTGFYDMWPAYGRWFVGDAIGVMVVAPLLLVRISPQIRRRVSRRALSWSMAALACLAAVTTGPWSLPWGGALPYMIAPALVLLALRTGLHGAVLGVAVVAVVVNGMTAAGYGPFSAGDTVSGLIEAQTFIATDALVALVVALLTRDLISREELDRAKDVFLQTVAHDLRNPLSALRGFAAILEANAGRLSPQEQSVLFRRMGATSDRMTRLLGALLDAERLASGNLGPHRERVDVNEVIRVLVRGMHVEGHEIVLEEEPLYAPVGVLELERIVENLIANALEHTPAGTTIWVRTATRDDVVELVVEDSGPGIPKDMDRTVFEPFARSQSGYGLGLSLVAHFADAHGGWVWIEKSLAGGAAFHVTLSTDPERRAPRRGGALEARS